MLKQFSSYYLSSFQPNVINCTNWNTNSNQYLVITVDFSLENFEFPHGSSSFALPNSTVLLSSCTKHCKFYMLKSVFLSWMEQLNLLKY